MSSIYEEIKKHIKSEIKEWVTKSQPLKLYKIEMDGTLDEDSIKAILDTVQELLKENNEISAHITLYIPSKERIRNVYDCDKNKGYL